MARVKKNTITNFSVKPKNSVPCLKQGPYIMQIDDVIYDPNRQKYTIKYLLADGTFYSSTYKLLKNDGERNDFVINLLADIETQALNSVDPIKDVNPTILNSCVGRFIDVYVIHNESGGRRYASFMPEEIYPATGFDNTDDDTAAANSFYAADENVSA